MRDMAPSMKPFRHTYLHEKEYRDAAKKLVLEDDILNKILVEKYVREEIEPVAIMHTGFGEKFGIPKAERPCA